MATRQAATNCEPYIQNSRLTLDAGCRHTHHQLYEPCRCTVCLHCIVCTLPVCLSMTTSNMRSNAERNQQYTVMLTLTSSQHRSGWGTLHTGHMRGLCRHAFMQCNVAQVPSGVQVCLGKGASWPESAMIVDTALQHLLLQLSHNTARWQQLAAGCHLSPKLTSANMPDSSHVHVTAPSLCSRCDVSLVQHSIDNKSQPLPRARE
jgi:hypothetical protein